MHSLPQRLKPDRQDVEQAWSWQAVLPGHSASVQHPVFGIHPELPQGLVPAAHIQLHRPLD